MSDYELINGDCINEMQKLIDKNVEVDLAGHLLHLIENGEGEKTVKVSVTYDDCEHVQNLKRIGNYKEVDFIALRGGKS